MTRILHLYILLMLVISLSSCAPNNSAIPTNVEDPSPIPINPTFTVTPTETVTPTLPATFTSLEAKERIRAYLQNTMDCQTPCFLGIMPEQTTFNEATNIFTSLGLQAEYTLTENNRKFYDTDYDIEEGLEISIILSVQDDIVKTIDVGINDTSEVGTPRKWSVYSPERLVDQYGIPTKVDLFLGRVTPTPTHSMVMYFDKVELIVSYTGSDLLNINPQLEICPLTNHVEHIRVRLGKDLRYIPKQGVPLEKASSINLKEYAELMLGDPNKACFNLKDEAFP